MKSDGFTASDAQIQTQMAWPETGETATGGWPPTCAASSRLLAEKVSAASSAVPICRPCLRGQRGRPCVLEDNRKEFGLPLLCL